MPADRLLDIRETCNYLGTSPLTLRRLRAEGIIRAYRIRRAIRFDIDEVKAALARADQEYGLRRREALIPSGGPKNKINAMFNGKLKGLCNLNTIDLVENDEKEDSDNNRLQSNYGRAAMDKHIVYSAIIKANEQANTELFGHQVKSAEYASAKAPSAKAKESGKVVKSVQRNHTTKKAVVRTTKERKRRGSSTRITKAEKEALTDAGFSFKKDAYL